jgi:biopolymer transport protein TolQ
LIPAHWHGIQLQAEIWQLVSGSGLFPMIVMAILLGFSLLSFTIIFSKWGVFRRARAANAQFLRSFRKTPRIETMAAAIEQHRAAPIVTVFDFGYAELYRQITERKRIANLVALERSLQLGVSEEIGRMERNMNWLATTAAVCPFIGLLGTVWGIMDAFTALGTTGAASISAVGPGIAEALLATALGLFAAIPAAVSYNYFGNIIKETGQSMEDFALEFLNAAERNYGEGG